MRMAAIGKAGWRARATMLSGLAGLIALGSPAAAQQAAPACDRSCLEGLVDKYLAALIAHKPAAAPFAADVRFTENHQPLKIGQGSWRTIDSLGTYKHYLSDPQSGQVGFIGTVREHGLPAFIDLRLKVVAGRITEAESFVIRDSGAFTRYEAMAKPEQTWFDVVPPEQRMSRDDMVRTVNKYFSAMSHSDGRADYSFFHPDCNRIEHALKTTNVKTGEAYGHSTDTDFASQTCEQQEQTGFLGFVTEIRDRRFLVIDEERQTMFAFATLDHNGTIRRLHLTTGKDFVLPPYFNVPRTLQVQEAFKLKDGKLYRIEMTLIEVPYGQKRPWNDRPTDKSVAAQVSR
jgi:hypothetical protein